jgi:phosphoglucosamine mutase
MPQILVNEKVGSKPSLESLPRFQAALDEGERELGDAGRILVRYSGTENKVRVMVEGPEEAVIQRLARTLADVLTDEIGKG